MKARPDAVFFRSRSVCCCHLEELVPDSDLIHLLVRSCCLQVLKQGFSSLSIESFVAVAGRRHIHGLDRADVGEVRTRIRIGLDVVVDEHSWKFGK